MLYIMGQRWARVMVRVMIRVKFRIRSRFRVRDRVRVSAYMCSGTHIGLG